MPQGQLMIIGGHEDQRGDHAILGEVVERAGGRPIVVATIAGARHEDTLWDTYRGVFSDLGADTVRQLTLDGRDDAQARSSESVLDDAGVLFFTGGDQQRIMRMLGDTRLDARIARFFHEQGGLVAGTSAGAAVMPGTMLMAGGGEPLAMAPGLGLLEGAIIDQHFAERGRLGRLTAAVAAHADLLGIGIDEDTAILVAGNRFEVRGTGAVYVIDALEATFVHPEARGDAITATDLRVHALSTRQGFDLDRREPLLA